jgi:hypothetical protein
MPKPVPVASPTESSAPVLADLPGPPATITALGHAWNARSLDSVAAVLAADYRITFRENPGDTALYSLTTLTKDDVLKVTKGTFHDTPAWEEPHIIELPVDAWQQALDPEHPDSTDHYRLLYASRARLSLEVGAPDISENLGLMVWHMVRGDAAVLSPDQIADPHTWYIRRQIWHADRIAAELALMKGDCRGPEAEPVAPVVADVTPPPREGVLVIHPLRNPACPTLDVRCDIPEAGHARVEVYDVLGRRVALQEVDLAAAGTVTIQAGAGASLRPGAYWVRLMQAQRRPVTKMVVVAR